MPDILIRNLDANLVKQLKAVAAARRRSLQAQIHSILERAVDSERARARTRRISEHWLKRLAGQKFSDSVELIRADREEREAR